MNKNVYPSEFEKFRLNNPGQIDNFIEALEAGSHRTANLGQAYEETHNSVLTKHNILLEDFNRIRRTSIDKLSNRELEQIIRIRVDANFPEPLTIMQKVVKPTDFPSYFNGTYKVRSFVTGAQDVKHLNTPEEIVDGLALHNRVGDKGEKSKVEIYVDSRPYTRNGITLSDNFVVIEFKYPSDVNVTLLEDTEIYEFT